MNFMYYHGLRQQTGKLISGSFWKFVWAFCVLFFCVSQKLDALLQIKKLSLVKLNNHFVFQFFTICPPLSVRNLSTFWNYVLLLLLSLLYVLGTELCSLELTVGKMEKTMENYTAELKTSFLLHFLAAWHPDKNLFVDLSNL